MMLPSGRCCSVTRQAAIEVLSILSKLSSPPISCCGSRNFATAYDGDFDPYIDDFSTKIPNAMDLWLSNCEGYPGMRSGKAKEWIFNHQISAEAWYVNSPNLTAAETRRLEKVGKAVEELLDQVG